MSWTQTVRDRLNAAGVMVAGCDLLRRSNAELLAAEQWALDAISGVHPLDPLPVWLRPFVAESGETLIETRRRARRELRERGL